MSMAASVPAVRSVMFACMAAKVFKFAVNKLAEVVDEALEANGLTAKDVRWLVPHQANRRIIDAMARKLDLPPDRVVLTVERHANTSAASIPLALAEIAAEGRIETGDLLLLEAMGRRVHLGFGPRSLVSRWAIFAQQL